LVPGGGNRWSIVAAGIARTAVAMAVNGASARRQSRRPTSAVIVHKTADAPNEPSKSCRSVA
jgi:hypothetical protein